MMKTSFPVYSPALSRLPVRQQTGRSFSEQTTPLAAPPTPQFSGKSGKLGSFFTAASLAIFGVLASGCTDPSGGVVQPTPPTQIVENKPQEEKPAENLSQDATAPAPPESAPATPINDIDEKLQTTGLEGYIHGADPNSNLFVFTHYPGNNFFKGVHYSLVAKSEEAKKVLQSLNRHDRVLVKGKLASAYNPQPHIKADSIEIQEAWTPETGRPEEKYIKEAKLPDELKDRTEASFMVHAVVDNGNVVVMEYKDNFVMMIVPDNSFTKDLFRGDTLTVQYKVQKFPAKPQHIMLNTHPENGKAPIVVIDSLKALHAQPTDNEDPEAKPTKTITQEGRLVLFPKSPQINRPVWAVEQKQPDGTSRFFTLVNFSDIEEWDKMDAKLKGWWDANPAKPLDGRNKLFKPGLKIKATGSMNVVSPNQANAQMFTSSDQLELVQ